MPMNAGHFCSDTVIGAVGFLTLFSYGYCMGQTFMIYFLYNDYMSLVWSVPSLPVWNNYWEWELASFSSQQMTILSQ